MNNALKKTGFKAFLLISVTTGTILHNPYQSIANEGPSWSPRVSEKLVKLPGNFMEKAVDNDFARSELAIELGRVKDQISSKRQTLTDLKEAARSAEGDLNIELQHQLLAEKQAFISLMRSHQDIRRELTNTKIRIYSGLLKKIKRSSQNMTPEKNALVSRQNAARKRFEQAISDVNSRMMSASVSGQSKYAQEYSKNLSAIRRLTEALDAHAMNDGPDIAGLAVSKTEYMRQLLAANEAEIALLDQEGKILSAMAKLVSLDAIALAEGSMKNDAPLTLGRGTTKTSPADTVDLFVQDNT
jgi:conjugal transfer/entry exclusion protein